MRKKKPGRESRKYPARTNTADSEGTLAPTPGTPALAASILRWPTTDTPPDRNAFVTAIFWGLMGFCYNTEEAPLCEVGFNSAAGQHHLEVQIYRINPDCGRPELIATDATDILSLRVIGASATPVIFYQTTDHPFDRYRTGQNFDSDFRWLPDLDSADFYPENYAKNPRFQSRLFVSNGTFYTRVRTASKFKLIDAVTQLELRPFGYIARFMALAINPQDNDYVRLAINNVTAKEFRREGDTRYQIIFKNECMGCVFDANHPTDETRRNDFHFNRKVVAVPVGRMKYALRLEGAGGETSPDFCATGARLNDEAPCMGSGYGQTPKLP